MTQEDQTVNSEPEKTPAEDIETLKKALEEEKAKSAANLAGWQRAQADFINYKRRSEQEKEDTIKLANSQLVLDLLPILDGLEGAFVAPNHPHKSGWAEGIRMIEQKLRAILEGYGLSPIKALGEPFDPNLHEAVTQARGKEGIVVGELQRGYMFRDRVIRHSKVIVGKGEPAEPEPGQDTDSTQPPG